MKSKFDEIFCEDNLIVLQLIDNWMNTTGGDPMPEHKLEAALQKSGFKWNLIRLYSSIMRLSVMQIIQIKQQTGQTHYQLNLKGVNDMLEIAIKMVRDER